MLDRFTLSYIETALWSSTDDSGEPLDHEYTIDDIDSAALQSMETDCLDFQGKYGDLYTDDIQAGHDFWLTRNGHGTGFWDRGDRHGDTLTAAARTYKETALYVGDDGMIHEERG